MNAVWNIILASAPSAEKVVLLATIGKLFEDQSRCNFKAVLEFIDVVIISSFLDDTMDGEEARPVLFDEISVEQFFDRFLERRRWGNECVKGCSLSAIDSVLLTERK
jgi:hypothetical protein